MKKLTFLIILILSIFSVSAQETVKLTVSGQGTTKEEATANALRSAIEQSFGVFVSANTQILNDEVVKDEIATISSGNIQEYKELGCITMPNGQQFVTLSATVSINNLISYAKSKGSTAEFAGQVFAMNMKMRKLNAENEKKAVKHMMNQLAILAPDLFRIELSLDGPYLMNNFDRYLDHYKFIGTDINVNSDNYYTLKLKLNYYTTETCKSFYNILVRTLRSLSLTEKEIMNYESSGHRTYDCRISNHYMSYTNNLRFRTDFGRELKDILVRCAQNALFTSNNLKIVGINKSYQFIVDKNFHHVTLTKNRPLYNLDDSYYYRYYYPKTQEKDIAQLNSVDSLFTTEDLGVTFTEEECYNIEKIILEKVKNETKENFATDIIDISSLIKKFYVSQNEMFLGDMIVNSIQQYEEKMQTWNETYFKPTISYDKTTINFNTKQGLIKIEGVYNEIYKIINCKTLWSEDPDSNEAKNLEMNCISSKDEKVKIRLRKPNNNSFLRQLIIYPPNNSTIMCFIIDNFSLGNYSILKNGYKVSLFNGGNYIFYTLSNKSKYGLAKYIDNIPIYTPLKFTNFYNESLKLTHGLVIAEIDNKWGAIDFTDNSHPDSIIGIPFKYDEIEPFYGGKSKAILNGNNIVVTTNEKRPLSISLFSEKKSINVNEETILKEGFKIIPNCGFALLGFKYKDKIGFVSNDMQHIKIFPQYDKVYTDDMYASKGMVLVAINNKWGAIDTRSILSKRTIPCIYDKMTPFRNGLSEVIFNGEKFSIDINGEKVNENIIDKQQ